MTQFRQQNVGARVAQAAAKVERLVNNLRFYDLTPLESIGIVNPTKYLNCGGTQNDYQGTDILIETADPQVKFGVQDKFRMSLEGVDLGIEFVRMYFSNREGFIVTDGGRDVYRIPYQMPIRYKNLFGIKVADRDWFQSGVKCDCYLLHAKDTTDQIWIKSKPVKQLVGRLFKEWVQFFSRLHDKVKTDVFSDERTLTLDSWFGTIGFTNVKCLRESSDRKAIQHSDHVVEMECMIAKAIAYIPYTGFQEGVDWVRCRRR